MSDSKQAHSKRSPRDTLFWLVALALLAGGVFIYYWFGSQPIFIRVGAVFAGVILSLLTAAQTVKGRDMVAFIRGSRVELNKIVWPTGQETVQTTIIVLIFVILFALFFAAMDGILINVTGWLTS